MYRAAAPVIVSVRVVDGNVVVVVDSGVAGAAVVGGVVVGGVEDVVKVMVEVEERAVT